MRPVLSLKSARLYLNAMHLSESHCLAQDQILTASMNGTLLTAQIYPPTGGWPTGPTFRINFVKDPQSPHTILAQTSEFDITSKDNMTLDASVDTPTTT